MSTDDFDPHDTLTNFGWIYLRVVRAKTPEELEQAETDIKCDCFEGEDYTKEEGKLNFLRLAVTQKRKELRCP